MKIALAGGGDAEDSRLLDEVFAAWLGPHGKLLYWPVALRGIRPLEACLEWVTATFAPWNLTDIALWTDLSAHQAGELDKFDGVYIGGGNTFSLLAQLQESGFDHHLKTYVQCGKPVYGGSAGAAILGRDIMTVGHIDSNDVGLTQTLGLDLAAGHVLWVHYQPEDDRLIEEYMWQYAYPVLAISERTGIVIEDAGMRTVGFEPAYRFDGWSKSEV
jgi:dipeptidase E